MISSRSDSEQRIQELETALRHFMKEAEFKAECAGTMGHLETAYQNAVAVLDPDYKAPALEVTLARPAGKPDRLHIRQWKNLGNLGPGRYQLHVVEKESHD